MIALGCFYPLIPGTLLFLLMFVETSTSMMSWNTTSMYIFSRTDFVSQIWCYYACIPGVYTSSKNHIPLPPPKMILPAPTICQYLLHAHLTALLYFILHLFYPFNLIFFFTFCIPSFSFTFSSFFLLPLFTFFLPKGKSWYFNLYILPGTSFKWFQMLVTGRYKSSTVSRSRNLSSAVFILYGISWNF